MTSDAGPAVRSNSQSRQQSQAKPTVAALTGVVGDRRGLPVVKRAALDDHRRVRLALHRERGAGADTKTAPAPKRRTIVAALREIASGPGGVAITISGTSTTEAGTAFMITLDGYTALPPGT